jgi:hypothetical protein
MRGRRGHDNIVAGYTTIYAISAYHHSSCEFESLSGEVYLIQQYVIKFVSDLLQVCGFLRVLWFSPPKKLTTSDITEILLKVALNTCSKSLTNFIT